MKRMTNVDTNALSLEGATLFKKNPLEFWQKVL
jgi:hypothetical protein